MIQVVRRSIVDVYSQYSFNRQSLAYGSQGKLYHLHNARFEPGKFGKAVMVEEGTTNYIVSPTTQTELVSPTSNFDQETYNHTHPYGGTAQSVAVTYSLSFDLYQRGSKAFSSIVVGGVVGGDAWDARVYPDGTGRNLTSVTMAKTDLGNGWMRWKYTFTIPTTSYLQTFVKFIAESKDYPNINSSIKNVQLEAKPYATSFIDGTRAAETLTIPTAGVLNPQEATVELRINSQFNNGTNYQSIITIADNGNRSATANKLTIWKMSNNSVRFQIKGQNYGIDQTIANFISEKVWTHIAVTYSMIQGFFNVYKNGTLVGSYSFTPDTFSISSSSLICVGNSISHSSTDAFNGFIDDLRISNRARTDTEIAQAYASGQPLPVDQYTTLKLPFDGPDGQRAAKVLIA